MADSPSDVVPGLMPLDGLFVEITGEVKLEDGEEVFDLNGEQGRVLGWVEDQEMYAVQLFSGYQDFIGADHLREIIPPEPETLGGFDVAWPYAASAHGIFASMVSQKINEKGFCVVQMFQDCAEDCRWMSKELTWGLLQQETEEEYLGQDVVDGKAAWLQYEAPGESGEPHALRTYSLEADMLPNMQMEYLAGLDRCDKAITNAAALMWPSTPFWEDERAFEAWGRTSGLVRAGLEEEDPEGLRRNTLGSGDPCADERHESFVAGRKLCLMYLIDNEGGELTLTPNDEAYEFMGTKIPLSRNKLVIFRCDAMGLGYAYRPEGRNLSLTAWVVDTPKQEREREELLRSIDGPQELTGVRTNVMAVQPRYPGCGYALLPFWQMLSFGCDAQMRVPLVRWDADIYWRKDFQPGFSASCHGGFLQDAEISLFDNVFFGIPEAEAKEMDPYHRCILEVGYETLFHAGHSRQQLKGFECGVFVGDTGSDWDTLQELSPCAPPTSRFAACTRLSCIMGLTGPTSTSETACSSSLVACGIAQMAMRRRGKDQRKLAISAKLNHSLVIGSNLLLGLRGYIALSVGMLSHEGRCFTFNESADGYARGEGVGGVKLKVCENDAESMNRLAILAGTAINQDGRSASLTAPNGPSQQEVIRQSFNEGGLNPKMCTVAECHGTGTPLGDPIEVGALQAVLRLDRGRMPMPKTTSKTNLGHLEAAAGLAGFIKCILMLQYSACTPNIHLATMNPHLDVDGYPVHFTSESLDYWTNSGVNGVSSFGFGGTNARADLWGHACHGQRLSITGILPKPRSIFV